MQILNSIPFGLFLKKIRTLILAIIFLVPVTSSADCNGLGFNHNAIAAFANFACAESYDEGWLAESCLVWEDLLESDIPIDGVDVWNLIANGGSSTFGPRPLSPNTTVSGRVVQPGTRVFVLTAVADYEVSIDLNYERGKAGVDLDVCSVNPDGDKTRIATFSDSDDDQNGISETVTLNTGAGIILKLKPRGGNAGLNAYEYNLNVSLNNQTPPITTLEREIDRPGGDYRNFPIGGTPSGTRKTPVLTTALRPANEMRICRKACADDHRCAAWTFVRGDDQKRSHCWLKKSVPSPVKNPCCASGVRN